MSELEKFLNEVKQKKDLAHKEICLLARDGTHWVMSIPAQPCDTDMTLQAPLDDIEKLLKIVGLITSMKHHQNEDDCLPSCAKCYLQSEADKIAGGV
jgi:hypothetical protein